MFLSKHYSDRNIRYAELLVGVPFSLREIGTDLRISPSFNLAVKLGKVNSYCLVFKVRFVFISHYSSRLTNCQIKRPEIKVSGHLPNWRRPTLPGSCPPSTIGAERLNFCVRYGNRCSPLAIVTKLSLECFLTSIPASGKHIQETECFALLLHFCLHIQNRIQIFIASIIHVINETSLYEVLDKV